MRPSSVKAKGRRLQQLVAADLCSAFNLSVGDVRSCPMGSHGEDVQLSSEARKLVPWSIECKNQERLNIWSAFDQAESNAGPYVPIVVAKRNHRVPLCTMRWSDALALLVRARARDPSDGEQVATARICQPHPPGEGSERSEGSEGSEGSGTSRRYDEDDHAGVILTNTLPTPPPGTSEFLRQMADWVDGRQMTTGK